MKNFIKSNISLDSIAILLVQAPVALSMLMGDDFVIQVANPQMLELWGKSREIIGKNLLDALPELKDQPFVQFLQGVKKTGVPYKGYEQIGYLVRNGKREECYFDFIYAPIYNDEETEIIGVSVVATEVTEQVVSKKRLTESEIKFENLIKQSDYSIALYKGRDLVIDIANDAMLKTWGKDASVIGEKLEDALPELEGQPFLDILKNIYDNGETYSANEDEVYLERNGKLEKLYYNFSYKPLYNQEGEVYAILNIAIDVTEAVITKQKLKESEQNFRNLADNLPIIVWTADKEGNIEYYNKKWYDYTGYEGIPSREEFASIIIHPDYSAHAVELWRECKKNKTIYEIEYLFRDFRREDTYHWFLGRSVPILDDDNEIVQWIGTCTNIDDFKQFQQQKDGFLGIASHELKTPITSLKLYSQFLEKNLRGQNDLKNAEVAKKMNEQINKMTVLVNDLLDVTKIQNGKIMLNKANFNFDELVKEIIEEEQMNTRHRILLLCNHVGIVFGDKNRISQVMSNFLSNAIKYSPNSDKVEVFTEITAENNVRFSVKDYGIGIPMDKKEKIFEQYYRVSGNKEHTFPGLGLGLYISTEIINRSGGKIFVNSKEGEGSVFSFEIPIAEKTN